MAAKIGMRVAHFRRLVIGSGCLVCRRAAEAATVIDLPKALASFQIKRDDIGVASGIRPQQDALANHNRVIAQQRLAVIGDAEASGADPLAIGRQPRQRIGP